MSKEIDKIEDDIEEWWRNLTIYQKKRIAIIVEQIQVELPSPFDKKKK